MKSPRPRGLIYVCPVCGAELAVVSPGLGDFRPRCCDVAMQPTEQRLTFFVCPKCGAEVGAALPHTGAFAPRCCDVEMRRLAA